LRKYSSAEIKKVLLEYRNTKKEYNSEKVLAISNKLFWAYVSGSKKADEYLNEVKKKFGPFDGAVSEGHSEIQAHYKLYKQSANLK
jgi:hypothetical protein